MPKRILKYISKKVNNLLSKEISDIYDLAISDEMLANIQKWTNMYEDNSPWVDNDVIKSMNIPSSVASELARIVTVEMKSEITDGTDKEGTRAEFLNRHYQRAVDNLRTETEYACAKGGLVFKPFVDGDIIAIDYVQADKFFPIRFDSTGDMVAAVFVETIQKGDNLYTRLEYHDYMGDGKNYIANSSYVRSLDGEGIGTPCLLTDVDEWAELEGEINIIGLDQPLFSYFKMPFANNKDSGSNLGVSVYSKCENLIEEVDRQYSKILWEFEATEVAIDVSIDMLKDGIKLPEGKERIYRGLDVDGGGKEDFYKIYSPQIREQSLFNGLDKLLQRVEFNCGLAYGTLSDLQTVEKTAEEIKTSKQRSYSTVVDIQKQLRVALEKLVYSMDFLTSMYELAPDGEYDISFEFDDSIVLDSKTEQAIMLQEVAADLIKKEFYLQRRYGVTEEQARDMLPDVKDDITVDVYDDLE